MKPLSESVRKIKTLLDVLNGQRYTHIEGADRQKQRNFINKKNKK